MGAPAPGLTRDAVVAAAAAVAARDGLDALSMRLVARKLGASPMGLYRHVHNKEDLLDALVERLLAEMRLPDEALPWTERLRALAAEARKVGRRHPELALVLLRRRAVGPVATAPRQAALRALQEGGLDRERAERAERLLSTFVLGFVASEAAGRFEQIDADADFEAGLDAIAGALSRLPA